MKMKIILTALAFTAIANATPDQNGLHHEQRLTTGRAIFRQAHASGQPLSVVIGKHSAEVLRAH